MPLPVLFISIVLFFILFFGIGFLLNMLFRSTWIMVILFPIVAILIVNKLKLIEYFSKPFESFKTIGHELCIPTICRYYHFIKWTFRWSISWSYYKDIKEKRLSNVLRE